MTHTPATPPADKSFTIILTEPIVRQNGSAVTELTIRKPKAGELRGLTVNSLVNGDIDALITVTPRISTPYVAEHEVAMLEAEDIGELGGGMLRFFMRTAPSATPATD